LPPQKKKQKFDGVDDNNDDGDDDDDDDDDDGNAPKKGKKKTQIRYDPDVPMTKEQLAAWRREARRVRNRESAAASRQRIRNRISELEVELEDWKSKYNDAVERLKALEQVASLRETGLPKDTAA